MRLIVRLVATRISPAAEPDATSSSGPSRGVTALQASGAELPPGVVTRIGPYPAGTNGTIAAFAPTTSGPSERSASDSVLKPDWYMPFPSQNPRPVRWYTAPPSATDDSTTARLSCGTIWSCDANPDPRVRTGKMPLATSGTTSWASV